MKVSHIGIAVNDVSKAEKLFVSILGLKKISLEKLDHIRLEICKVAGDNVVIELIKPMEGEQTVTKFLQDRGEGIHHISFEVDDVKSTCEILSSKGLTAIWKEPKLGSDKNLVNFLHPRQTHGVLIEFNQSNKRKS